MFSTAQWPAVIGAGVSSAAIYSLAGTGSLLAMMLVYFCQLPLFMVGLSLGTTAVLVAGGIATLAILVLHWLAGALSFAALNLAPVLLLTRQALLGRPDGQGGTEWYPSGLLLLWATGLAAIIYTVGMLWLGAQPEGVMGTLRAAVGAFADQMTMADQQQQRDQLVEVVVRVLPGMAASSWLIMMVINGTLAQVLLARMNRNMRPSPDFATLALPQWMPFALAMAAAAGLLLPGTIGYYGQNLTALLMVPFFFVGLAVMHALCRRSPAGRLLLGLFYVLLLVLGWPMIFVAILGLIEQWVGLRHRVAPPDSDQED